MTVSNPREFLLALNACWQTGDLDALADYYHPDVVLLPPDMGAPISGREAVVESYQDFFAAATLEHFRVADLEVFSFPATESAAAPAAVTHMAHLTFSVSYTLDGDTYVETGMEVYALGELDGRLKILWRHQSVLDSRLAEKV